MKNVIFLLVFMLVSDKLFSNSLDSLPTHSELFASLRAFHGENSAAQTVEFSAQEKYRWMKWMPQGGILYDVGGTFRPIVSFSFGQVYSTLNEKEKTKAKIDRILRGSSIEFKQDSFELVALLRKYDILLISLSYLESIQIAEDKKFEILKKEWYDGNLTGISWEDAKIQVLKSGMELKRKEEDIRLLEIEIYRLARF